MNQYKIEVKQTCKKEVAICAKNEKEALKLLEKVCTKSNILKFFDENANVKIEAKIVEKNNEPIRENGVSFDEDELKYVEDLLIETHGLIDEADKNFVEIKQIIENT